MPNQQATGLPAPQTPTPSCPPSHPSPRLGQQPQPTPQQPQLPEGWLTRQQAAARLGIGLRTLDLWRSLAWGPPAARVPCRGSCGGRLICLYRAADLDRFRQLVLPRSKFGRVRLRVVDPDAGTERVLVRRTGAGVRLVNGVRI